MSDKCYQIQTTDDQPFSGPVLEEDPKAHNHSQNHPLGTKGQTSDKPIFLQSSPKKAAFCLQWLSSV